MSKGPNFRELLAEAESSVQAVKDPELRRIAFQKVLDELLGGGAAGRESRPERRAKQTLTPKSNIRKAAAAGPKAYIRDMVDENFFKKQRAIADVKAELENRGHHIPMTSLSGPLQGLCKNKVLRRQKVDGHWMYSNY